jgi:hypothetical protein
LKGGVDACRGSVQAGLHQTQLCCPFDGCPAVIDVEFTKDALRMGAHRTQGDHEFTRNFWPGKLGLEQTQNFKFTLAQRLNEIFNRQKR